MSDKVVEQAEKSASKIGKFNTAEDLLAAYNALESEFTKRCQLVKQLQTELEAIRAQAQDAPHDVAPRPQDQTRSVPETETGEESAVTPAVSDDVLNTILQNAYDYADVLSAIPEVMSACIARYKQRLIKPSAPASAIGCAVIVPSERPKTLSDAKRLADALLNG